MTNPIIDGAEPRSHTGSGQEGAVVLHGFTGNPASMRGVAEALADAGFHVELPLLPGHGTVLDDMLPTRWADWIGEPHDSFSAALRGVVARREHHRRVFDILRPGFDFAAENERRTAAGDPSRFDADALFADVRPTFATLRAHGHRIGVAGNTSAGTELMLRQAGLPLDFVGSSETFGVEKPDPAYFLRLVALAGVPAAAIAYVGDRLDNDVLPAQRAGMRGIFLRRGLWADVQRHWPEAELADFAIDGLDEVFALVSAPAKSGETNIG